MNLGVPAEGGCREGPLFQAMSIELERQRLLAFTAILEAATGLALIATPAFVATLLLAASLDKTGVTVARAGGAALIALGIACWPSRSSAGSRDEPYSGMLVYNVLATLVLAEVAIGGEGGGKLLWPAIVLHAILSGLLAFARFGGRPDGIAAPLLGLFVFGTTDNHRWSRDAPSPTCTPSRTDVAPDSAGPRDGEQLMTCRTRKLASHVASALLAGSILCSAPAVAQAQDASAKQILKAMSTYLASQKDLSGSFDAALDVVTPRLERVTFNASGTLLLARPGQIRATRKGGYADMELVSDGTTATIVDRTSGSYAQTKSPGTIDSLIDMIRTGYGLDMPAGDLLMTNSYDRLMEGVVEAKHIGMGVVDGYDCEHLAFRNADTDWQLWVRTGNRPLPCKYVISSKTVVGYPTYTIQFRNWSAGRAATADAFRFTPSAGAKKVGFDQMSAIGEIPPPATNTSGGQ